MIDIDDKVIHYVLWFGGMFLASLMHRVADLLDWDTCRAIKKFFQRR